MRLAIAFIQSLVLAAQQPAAVRPAYVTASEAAAADTIRPELIRAHIRFLSHDLLEGRGPATRGDRLTQTYIAAQLEALGLEPAAPEGGWLQPFDVVGISTRCPETVAVTGGGARTELRFRHDYVAFSGVQGPTAQVDDAELVFVGHGIVAPEYQWDDFKGVDLAGKVLLIMNNDPEDDPALFAGKTRLYYGRWDYKYEQAARVGAAGAVIIHTTPSAGYPWQVVETSWTGEQFALPSEGEPEVPVKAWATEDAARRIATLGGHDLDALRAAAGKRDFRPVPLGVRVSVTLTNEVKRKQTANVIGRLPGRDAALSKQAVIYTAHHDHLGVKEAAQPGADAIFNGAQDNASGVAALLAVARAYTALPAAPRRTVVFAAVAAEEAGLLGSKYLAAHPPLPAGRLAANVNIDAPKNLWGRTRDVVAVGLGKSDLDDWIHAVAALQRRKVVPDQHPDRGYFYRSDQFSLAKIGVPAAYLSSGSDVIGRPPGWGAARDAEYTAKDYHQPSDELRPDWDYAGAVEDAQLAFYVGLKVANSSKLPAWRPGDEFEAARKKALAAVRE